MLFEASEIDDRESQVLEQIDGLRRSLRLSLHEPRRWSGSLRRLAFARNIQASNSIEGFEARLDDAAAVALGEEPLDASDETRLALEGYRNAMTYVLQLCEEDDPDFAYDVRLVKSLHFMMTAYALANRPGRWRAGPIFVHREDTDEVVHRGADIDQVSELMAALVSYLNSDDDELLRRAAMVHLNLVMIHPFRDGNGRMARCLQSLVLARSGLLSPVFMSIEEYLGHNTPKYYEVLGQVGGGGWHPERDTRPWLRFVATAHLRQAQTLQRRVREAEQLWEGLTRLLGGSDAERVLLPLFDAASGLRIRRSTYMRILEELGDPVSEPTASRDLKWLADRGLLQAHGEKRGRFYVAGPDVRELVGGIRAAREPRSSDDPFAPTG